MLRRKRKGFTLIELLVVIAIIGILAAMLFPVFARARESARKIQCLSNVKNLATATVMYLTDWDRLWPGESDRREIDYFNTAPGGGGSASTWPDVCNHAYHGNPYLRPAVVLEEYVKNRDIWRCPSAKLMNGAQFIVPMGPNGDFVQAYKDGEPFGANVDYDYGPCTPAFPTGWGGDVTDSLTQQRMADVVGFSAAGEGHKVFVQGIGTNGECVNMNPNSVSDPSWFVILGDSGRHVSFWDANGLIWPDWCRIEGCSLCSGSVGCCNADWVNCTATQNCGLDWTEQLHFLQDGSYRKTFARHMGGSNVGFLDGHAKWFLSEAILNATQSNAVRKEDADFQGICTCLYYDAVGRCL